MSRLRNCILIILLLASSAGGAQPAVHIPAGSNVFIGGSDSLAVWGNVLNSGTLITTPKSYIIFGGEKWLNETGSKMFDASFQSNTVIGGTFEFRQSSLFPGVTKQYLNAGFGSGTMSGAGFSNLVINNPNGLFLESDLGVARELRFYSGHLFLSGKTAVLGNDTASGNITGFSEHSYVVTGETPGSSHLLIRNMKKGRDYIFPLGERADATLYHPVKVIPASQPEDISASVFMGTYESGNSGLSIRDSTVNTTWHFEKLRPSTNQFQVSLQHNSQNEGVFFSANKQMSYVGVYYKGGWKPVSPYGPPVPGSLTTGSPLADAALNTGSFEIASTGDFFLTKFSAEVRGATEIKAFNVFTPNGDGQNDYFDIARIDNYPDNEVVIYNRWNNEVFKTKGYSSSNRFTGKGLPDGTYFYVISIQAGTPPARKIFKGYVTIVR